MSQVTSDADARLAGLDPVRLRDLEDFLDRLTEDGRIPGWSVAVSRRSVLAHAASGGYRDTEAALPVEADTIFRVYSMTKPVTAAAALVLYELGLIGLSDPVAEFIPAFRDARVFTGGTAAGPETEPAAQPITLWHLLTHTAGLTYGFHRAHPVDAMYRQAGHEIEAPPGCSLEDACETWARLPLLFHPGSEWNYSVATDVLGRVVEVVSGKPLGEFCAERIFTPLGMRDTAFTVPAADRGRLAQLYAITPSGGLALAPALASTVTAPGRGHFGGGGLASTVGDYLRFATMLGNRGDSRRRARARPANRRPHGPQPPARRRRPAVIRPADERRVPALRRRPGPWPVRTTRPGPGRVPRIARRVRLGRGRQHRLLGRPSPGTRGGVHDPGATRRGPARPGQTARTRHAGPRMKVGLFVTCLVDAWLPPVGKAAAAVLERLGVPVDVPPRQSCCGQLHVNTGYPDLAVPLVRRHVRAFADYEAIVTPSGSCAAAVRHQHADVAAAAGDEALLRGVREIAARTYELSEFLIDVLGVTDVGAYFPHRVTYHPTCHSLRLLRVADRPLRLLRAVRGIDLVELPDADQCCGFGGTFALKNPAVSGAMLADKAAAVRATGARFCTAGDASCLLHIGGGLSRRDAGTRPWQLDSGPAEAIHIAEILASTP